MINSHAQRQVMAFANDEGPNSGGDPISEEEARSQLHQTEDQSARYYAAWWSGRMRSQHPAEAVPFTAGSPCPALST